MSEKRLPQDGTGAPRVLPRGGSLGRYVILDLLGEGGMGVVYRAYDPELDRGVAIKILRPGHTVAAQAHARLMREAQAMARLSHPNVIAVHDVGTHDGNVFIAMELVEGGTLNDWLDTAKRTPAEILAKYCDAGRGLAAAHAAGLIHRDFKPENVLVGRDGRCRVTDFGLVRLSTPSSEAIPERPEDVEEPSSASAKLTRAGALVGTPQYMAWEQFEGKPGDERSDQYSLCSSIYWALFSAPPPSPDAVTVADRPGTNKRPTGPALRDLTELPKEPKLPVPVRRALLRGLSLKPEDRFGSVAELLAELEFNPKATQRRWLVGAGAAAALIVAGLAATPFIEQRRHLCRGADDQLAEVWGPNARDAMSAAFIATKSPLGTETAQRVSSLLDAYGASWVKMHNEACEATRIRGDQSDQVLALRMVCLDRRLQQLGTLTKLFRGADSSIVEKAYDAVEALPPMATCADVAALSSPVPRPESPARLEKLQRLEQSLAQARALLDAARFQQSLKLTESLIVESSADPWPPLQAELLNTQGWLLVKSNDLARSQRVLQEALVWAERGHFESEKISILARLVYVVGALGGRPDEAKLWAELGRATASRSSDMVSRLELESRIGLMLLKMDAAAARETFERAAVLGDQTIGREHPVMVTIVTKLAEASMAVGEYPRALDLLGKVLAIAVRTRGPSHPDVGAVRSMMAFVQHRLGAKEEAYGHIRAAIDIWTKAYGADHIDVANGLDILATMLLIDGSHQEALAAAERSLAIKVKILGTGHVETSYSLNNMGQALLGLGRSQEALKSLEESIRLRESAKFSPEAMAEVRFAYARALWDTKTDRSRAIPIAQQALEAFRRSKDTVNVDAAEKWVAAHRSPAQAAK